MESQVEEVTISRRAAEVLVSLLRQVTSHDAASKINIGRAQMELEQGLAKFAPPKAEEPNNRARRRREQRENGAAAAAS